MANPVSKFNHLPLRQRQEYKDVAIRLGMAMAKVAKITASFPNTFTYETESDALEEASFAAYKLMRILKAECEDTKEIVIVGGED